VQTPRISKENVSRLAAPVAAIIAIGLLAGASCKKENATPRTDPKDVVAAADAAKGGSGTPTPVASAVDKTALPGFDISKLAPAKQELFYKMVTALPSPCGKAHSLRTSVTQDPSCKRAPFAVRLVNELIVDEQGEDVVREIYEARYVKDQKQLTINLVDAPMVGSADAPVTLVEFFDYGCPACVQLKPVLDRVIEENKGKLKVFYKMYPLVTTHPDSMGCAQAAMAAKAQGKFHEMHDLIFEKFGAQKKDDLRKYAAQVGLDLTRYDNDVVIAEGRVKSDMKDGTDIGVDGTPALFLNGRAYGGPADPKYFAMAIDEEIAVNAPAPAAPATPTPAAPATK